METPYRQRLKEKDLPVLAGISASSVTKLSKNMNVSTEILEKVCRALNCDPSYIIEMTEDILNNIEYMNEKTK